METDKKKILIVDDNADSRELVMKILRNKNYQLSDAIDGEDALIKINADKPDLILMDISMPKIDGYELTRRIKSQKDLCDIKVVALTAHAMKGDKEKALASGCLGYITKPINVRIFGEQIEIFLNSSG
ncbi:MAG: response regulator [Proteobacteria bacterium]|nr:response regulator [Pseudomonadota bacterium]MBU1139010.1 response regulator [Pseudomonadota bacterium]MBU1234265.1 response regulator [Pseudomonadota bacterium]MBU1420333.1 response regulator [Pseudomonadota bacterium]MBU1454125.1 response regulator [Pseudomonadota bacterium]